MVQSQIWDPILEFSRIKDVDSGRIMNQTTGQVSTFQKNTIHFTNK